MEARRVIPLMNKFLLGTTNYAESVKVIFDPNKVSYPQLLNYYWRHVDPTVKDAQFCDEGRQYKNCNILFR